MVKENYVDWFVWISHSCRHHLICHMMSHELMYSMLLSCPVCRPHSPL